MQKKLEQILMPVTIKLGNNVVLRSLRDGFLIITPLIIVTSIFLLIGNLPIPGWTEFWSGILGPHWTEWFSAVSNSVFSFTGLLVLGYPMPMVKTEGYKRFIPVQLLLFHS
ncbi:hypothetical protein LTWDN19_09230 [Latilactobacillus curvatus]|uniref:Uncharacterized protein n=1 Tax=Latilactobacillus curvatus TaxID=28038 RepID=A0ABN6GHW2_LATCU|nr:hypothetical protein LTWDN19_09230 [Latilactobacillus curvatus]